MASLPGRDPPGATPIEDEDLDALIPTFVATRQDLNLVEQINIEKARRWAFRSRMPSSIDQLLSVNFAFEVHRRMFGDVWRWAGKLRLRPTIPGVEPYRIVTEMKLLLDDASFWHDHNTYSSSELAVRFHHRLVHVRPFTNGNGRHSRFLADLYLHVAGEPPLTWGAGQNLIVEGDTRGSYIAALRAADNGDVGPLVQFALS